MRAARLDQLGDEARPSGLMVGSNAASAVPVEVLVKQQIVAKMGIFLHPRVVGIQRPAARGILEKDPTQTVTELGGHFIDAHELSGTGGALDPEIVSLVVM